MKFGGSSFRFSFCCCVPRRSGNLVVGICDVILGILCILATIALLAQNLTEQAALKDLEIEDKAQNIQELIAGFILVLIACGVPSLMTFVTGIVSIYASSTCNPCLSAYSVALNLLLVIGLIGTDVFLYCLGLRLSLLIVYLTATALQIYFGLVVFDFYRFLQATAERRMSEEGLTAHEDRRKLSSDP